MHFGIALSKYKGKNCEIALIMVFGTALPKS